MLKFLSSTSSTSLILDIHKVEIGYCKTICVKTKQVVMNFLAKYLKNKLFIFWDVIKA